jgi:hypothetical protein
MAKARTVLNSLDTSRAVQVHSTQRNTWGRAASQAAGMGLLHGRQEPALRTCHVESTYHIKRA